MAYCRNCGSELVENAKFCQKCGCATGNGNADYSKRQQEFAGKIYKCPNCGEVLKAFEINCPTCGHELRGTKASSAVKEFALKLEAIESRREYEKPRGLFAAAEAQQRIPTVVYHVAVNGQATDPFDISVLAQMVTAGQLTADSLVWKAGMAQWAKAGTVDELKNLFVSTMPPIPPQI